MKKIKYLEPEIVLIKYKKDYSTVDYVVIDLGGFSVRCVNNIGKFRKKPKGIK